MTITEKIIADHCSEKEVRPGDLVNAKVDIVMANDVTAPIAIHAAEQIGAEGVFDPDRVIFVLSHFVPAKDIKAAEQAKITRDFVRANNLPHLYEGSNGGIEHALLPQRGLVVPGDLMIGADSHSCTYGALGCFSTGVGSTDFAASMVTGEFWMRVPETIKYSYKGRLPEWTTAKDLILFTIGEIGVDGALYKAMEFEGEAIRALPMENRFTITNMAIEAGGKNGIIEPDETTLAYVKGRAKRKPKVVKSDPDAQYAEVYEWDVSKLEPQVAYPSSPENTRSINEVDEIYVDQAVIGSCTNGWFSDLQEAADILKGQKVSPNVRLIVFPATQDIYNRALKEGLMDIFIDAGALVSTPTCGPCLGGHMGVLGPGEKCISTTNRNFVGRMGHREAEVYLSSPTVTAASAVAGKIVHPETIAGKKKGARK
jgi:3-isopropylmalate/(R)-2-methylmalate dehydratase large subunit